MTVIYLYKQSGPYKAGKWVEVTVTCENNYTCSNLFHRYKHTLDTPTRGCIHVFKSGWNLTKYLTLTPDCEYSCAKLQCVHVYFNQYENRTPLLFVLIFQNGDGRTESSLNKYYPRSKFDTEMNSCKTKKIEELCDYKDDKSILCPLIEENDRLDQVLTYDIMQIATTNNGGPCTYNCNKINVKNDTNGDQPTLTGNGFKVYKHQPSNGYTGKPACIVYNCNALLDATGKTEVKGVQNQTYTSVTVYFGGKAKRGCTDNCKAPGAKAATCTTGTASPSPGQTCTPAAAPGDGTTDWQDVPLMIALHKQGNSDGQTDYYVHRRRKNGGADGNGNDTYYWVQLKLENNGQNELKTLLTDIGMPEMIQGQNGTQLSQLLGEKPSGDDSDDSDSGPTYLELLLKRLEFDLTDSLVILMDKKDVSSGHNGGYGDGEIQTAISTLQPTENSKWINPLKLNGQKITLSNANSGTNKCLTKHKYRVVAHDFSKAVGGLGAKCSAGLRFLMPTIGNSGNYAQLRLYPKSTETEAKDLLYIYYTKSAGANGGHTQNESKVYVVFYNGTGDGSSNQGDPRPLLLCYRNEVYRPKGKDGYEQKWVRVPGVEKLCDGPETSNGKNETLLKAVTETVGFLNKVDLSQHPNGTSTSAESQPCQAGAEGESSTATTCNADQPTTTGSTCTYEVDKFQGKPIQVKVTCSQVNPKGSSCYRKLTHRPAGLNGKAPNANFRLGDVAYCPNGGSRATRTGKIDYYKNGSSGVQNNTATNKWAPLTSVSAYFYDQDKGYCDPLLVVLEFKNGSANEKECYKLTNASGTGLEWQKDQEAAKCLDKEGPDLVSYLDGIRYCLKQVVKVELQHNGTSGNNSYELMGRNAKDGTPGQFDQPINGTSGSEQVNVQVQQCPALTLGNYKCFKHNLTEALRGHHHEVAGLAFTLPGKDDKVIEIPLGEGQCAGEGASQKLVGQEVTCSTSVANGQTAKITYNQCMGDVCVYFYGKGGGDGGTSDQQTDTVPLMLLYNKRFYRPQDRDNYFKKWVCVTDLCTVDKAADCCCSVSGPGQHGTGCQQLVNKLNEVNLALNRIDLDKASTDGYGLPENGQGSGSSVKVDKSQFDTVRVKVVTQNRPSTGTGNGAHVYQRVVHRTKNGFQIGDIKYNNQDFATDGVKINGAQNGVSGDTIPIASGGGNHKSLVSTYKWNTVVVYYSCSDKDKKLPQLIVILKTESPVDTNTAVTVSGGKYGYYVLATQSGVNDGSGYEYQWRLVNGTEKPTTPVRLDDETDFELLNSAVILLERTKDKGETYGEKDISKAVTSAIRNGSLKESPGNTGQDINRLKNRDITVTQEKCTADDSGSGTCTSSGEGTSPGVCCCKCLTDTGFKVVAHCLDNLVTLGNGFKGKLPGITLITGLRFLIPTRTKGEYNQLTLKDNGPSNGSGTIKYHKKEQNKICVYFYGSDPRPLLVCYDKWAYASKDKNDYDAQKWTKVTELDKCGCTKPPPGTCEKCKLLEALVRVSDFLNPVNLNPVLTGCSTAIYYVVHTFNGQKIQIEVKVQYGGKKFCYDKYTHTHAGVENGSGGDGFRLGNIHHCEKNSEKICDGNWEKNCIKETQNGVNGASTNTGTADKCISASDVGDTKTYKPSPEVVVYYYKKDNKHEHPLLVALRSDDGGTTQDQNHKPYFELQKKVDPGHQKEYTKGSQPDALKLTNTSPEGDLAKKLDSILFAISVKLRVVLSTRPVARPYSAKGAYQEDAKQLEKLRKDKAKNIAEMAKNAADEAAKARGTTTGIRTDPQAIYSSLTHHVLRETSYDGQLFEADGKAASPPPTQITVREVDCFTIYSDAGYRCFRHLLTTATGIEQVGGLKLAVFSGQGTQGDQTSAGEITLCTGDKTAKNEQVQLSYTTCKGDIHVF